MVRNVKQVGFEPELDRKTATEGAEVTRSGRLFQTWTVMTKKLTKFLKKLT